MYSPGMNRFTKQYFYWLCSVVVNCSRAQMTVTQQLVGAELVYCVFVPFYFYSLVSFIKLTFYHFYRLRQCTKHNRKKQTKIEQNQNINNDYTHFEHFGATVCCAVCTYASANNNVKICWSCPHLLMGFVAVVFCFFLSFFSVLLLSNTWFRFSNGNEFANSIGSHCWNYIIRIRFAIKMCSSLFSFSLATK